MRTTSSRQQDVLFPSVCLLLCRHGNTSAYLALKLKSLRKTTRPTLTSSTDDNRRVSRRHKKARNSTGSRSRTRWRFDLLYRRWRAADFCHLSPESHNVDQHVRPLIGSHVTVLVWLVWFSAFVDSWIIKVLITVEIFLSEPRWRSDGLIDICTSAKSRSHSRLLTNKRSSVPIFSHWICH